MYRTMEYEINELSHHVDANHIQACTDLEKASQFLTEALLSETQRSSALRRLIHRLEQRAAENGRSLSEQVESNRQLKLQVDELQKQLEDKDNSLTQAKQSISILKNELRELQQQQQQQQQQQSHQSSHRTIQDVTEWLQDGESQTIVASIVKEEESVLQNPGVGIKKEEDAYDGYPCMQIEEDGITTEQTSYSSADIEVELPQVEDEMSDMAPVDSSEMSQSESPDPARSLRSSMQLVKRSTSATQDQQATTSKDHQDGKRPNAGIGLRLPLSAIPKFEAIPETEVDNGRPYKCPVCGEDFSTKSAMKKHQQDIHPADNPSVEPRQDGNTGGNLYVCQHCGKRFSQEGFLSRHQLIHTAANANRHQPIHTGANANRHQLIHTGANANRHQLVHTAPNANRSEPCGKSFPHNPTNLAAHMRLHTGAKPYHSGQSSSRSFSQTRLLRQHMHADTDARAGEKAFQCGECGKCFLHARTLATHKLIHTGKKPYQCQLCGKRFLLSHHLATHTRVHTGEKPYQCAQCGRRFSHSGNLKVHQRKEHPNAQ
ncbi:zinc finger protein 16-like isoform X2 [Engraulis encrasicolus]|uniref:zinc finger protein 16-like isoform X2 n=1 Tax=Engraulis encrasicolus TaxID=184585 RepID=UPI002FD4CEC4